MDVCNPKDCPFEPRIKSLEEANKEHSNTHREIFKRLNQVEQDNAVQSEQYKTIIEKLDKHDKKHSEMAATLQDIQAKPGKRWDGLVDKAIWAVVAAVIAFLLGRFGL